MDKLTRSYSLENIKELIKKNKVIHNSRVISQANDLGFSETEVHDAILNLEKESFYKSTTEYYNPHIWQDVYKKVINKVPVYIKFQVTEGEFLLRSFKKDESA